MGGFLASQICRYSTLYISFEILRTLELVYFLVDYQTTVEGRRYGAEDVNSIFGLVSVVGSLTAGDAHNRTPPINPAISLHNPPTEKTL
jgi:hypothetical protein